MYYVGFQLVQNIKFMAFTGLAVSKDGGESFERFSNAPVLDRNNDGPHLRAIHSVHKEKDTWRIWYSQGDGWQDIDGIPYPRYHIRYTESQDGITFDPATDRTLIKPQGNEYRIGRPRVTVSTQNGAPFYEMRYTFDTLDKQYQSGYAISSNGVDWVRKDELLGLPRSAQGWDSEMTCYPCYLETQYGTYLFYSGNNMGQTGVGYCVLQD